MGICGPTFELVKSLEVGFIEMLEPRPCGGYASAGDDTLLAAEDRKKATDFFIQGNTSKKYRDYPLVYYVAYMEAPEQSSARATFARLPQAAWRWPAPRTENWR